MWTILFFCVWAVARVIGDQDGHNEDVRSRLVQLDQGPIKGYMDNETGIYVFHGIPYATAPSGKDKFKAPLPPPTWTDPLEAVDKGILCPQGFIPGPSFENKTQQEQCLILNVYVPDVNVTDLPVVVYVHGGAYQFGYGNLVTPKNLVKRNRVIIVTFNYRLGIHGFLCLGTKDVPGNAGMKDQVAALRWVKSNIATFGGNPEDVTLAGYSAGSASVNLLMLSPSAKGLFKQVIAESGSSIAVWTIQMDPLEIAKKYAKKSNFTHNDIHALESFYKTATYDWLTSDLFMDKTDSTFMFTPCIEQELVNEESFLVENPVNILQKGSYVKLPMLYGFSDMEGIFRIPFFGFWKDKMNEKFSDFLPGDLQFENEKQKEDVAKAVKHFYFGDQLVGNETVEAYIYFFTDVLFTYSMLRALKLQVAAGNNQMFLFEYSFVDDNEIPVPAFPQIRGADHCAETGAVFDGQPFMIVDEKTLSKEHRKMKALMRDLWLNFMTKGQPVPEVTSLPPWPPTHGNASPHMSLGKTLELRGPLLQRRFEFWNQIYEKHYHAPIPPPVHSTFSAS